MKLDKIKVMQLALCGATLLVVPTLLFFWADRHLVSLSPHMVYLLTALFIVLGIDLCLTYMKEELFVCPKTGNNHITGAYSYIKISIKIILLGILLILAVQLNACVFFLLLGLIPIDFLIHKQLYAELIMRSRILQEQILDGRQEISASNMAEIAHSEIQDFKDPPTLKKVYRTLVLAPAGSRILRITSALARIIIMVLAVCDFIIQDFIPLSLALYCVLLPLFLSSLSEVVNGSLNTLDLINSIHYVEEITARLKASEGQSENLCTSTVSPDSTTRM